MAGLVAANFTVREEGVRQVIAHFGEVRHGDESDMPVDVAAHRDEIPPPLRVAEPRTFLIVLGRGRLQGPARGLDAAIAFVRENLLPQDLVGIVAYDRASDLTNDRESVVRLLERYRNRHEAIEARLDHWFGAISQVLFGSREPPPGIQAEINALFDVPGLPSMRSTASLGAAAIPVEPARDWTAQDIDITAMSDDQNVAATRDDVDKLYASINYLRVIDGEKHIVFLSEEGLMNLGQSEDADSIAAVAADARVTLSAVHTTGIATSWEVGPYRRCQSSGSIVGATVRPSRLTIDGATYRRRILCLSLRRCWPQGDRLSHAL